MPPEEEVAVEFFIPERDLTHTKRAMRNIALENSPERQMRGLNSACLSENS